MTEEKLDQYAREYAESVFDGTDQTNQYYQELLFIGYRKGFRAFEKAFFQYMKELKSSSYEKLVCRIKCLETILMDCLASHDLCFLCEHKGQEFSKCECIDVADCVANMIKLYQNCTKNPKKKVYISGPITGVDNYQEIFERAEMKLETLGFEPVNPCKGEEPGHSWEWYMKRDIKKLCDCDIICLLPGWEESKGAMMEYDVALKLGLEIKVL